jgi:hypothetical protein
MHHAAGRPDEPSEAIELDETAHALLWGLRAIVVGRGDCPALRRAFLDLCGDQGDEALSALFVIIKQLAFRSRRRLSVHLPGCCAISGDELRFLSIVASAQTAEKESSAWLAGLIGSDVDLTLSRSIGVLANILLSRHRRVVVQVGCVAHWSRPIGSLH